MAKRRMFSPDIVASDVFVDMPMSSQALYFHLCLHADDDGFIANPKQICRMVGANVDDLNILFAKRYLLNFPTGVAVVKHWLIHNLIRSDLYVETTYKTEKQTLGLNEYGAYTELREGVSQLKHIEEPEWLKKRRGDHKKTEVEPNAVQQRTANVPQTERKRLLGKDRLGNNRISKDILVNSDKPSARMGSSKDLFYMLVKALGYSDKVVYLDTRKRQLGLRLRNFTPAQLVQAAKAIYDDPHMQGENDRGKRFGTIDYLLRSDINVAKYLEEENGLTPGGKIDVSKYV